MSYRTITNWIYSNIANFITCIGLLLCFFLMWFVVMHRQETGVIATLAIVILLTDFFDGRAARYFNITSKFGAAVDRLRDKVVLATAFVYLVSDSRIHISVKITLSVLLIIELVLLTIWVMGVTKKKDVATNKSGKVKMFLLSIAIILCFLAIMVGEKWQLRCDPIAPIVVNLLLIGTLYFAVKSLIAHKKKYLAQP